MSILHLSLRAKDLSGWHQNVHLDPERLHSEEAPVDILLGLLAILFNAHHDLARCDLDRIGHQGVSGRYLEAAPGFLVLRPPRRTSAEATIRIVFGDQAGFPPGGTVYLDGAPVVRTENFKPALHAQRPIDPKAPLFLTDFQDRIGHRMIPDPDHAARLRAAGALLTGALEARLARGSFPVSSHSILSGWAILLAARILFPENTAALGPATPWLLHDLARDIHAEQILAGHLLQERSWCPATFRKGPMLARACAESTPRLRALGREIEARLYPLAADDPGLLVLGLLERTDQTDGVVFDALLGRRVSCAHDRLRAASFLNRLSGISKKAA